MSGNLKIFLAAGQDEQFHDLGKQCPEVKGVHVEDHFSGFYLTEVKQAVDQGQEVPGRGQNQLGKVFLPLLKSGAKQQFAQADNPVHRGSNLMADHSQKIGFCLVGTVGMSCFFLQSTIFLAELFYRCLQLDNLIGLFGMLVCHVKGKRESCVCLERFFFRTRDCVISAAGISPINRDGLFEPASSGPCGDQLR